MSNYDLLIKQFEKYKSDKMESEKQDAVFYSKIKDVKNLIKTTLEQIDDATMDNLNINLEIDLQRLEDVEYVTNLNAQIEQTIETLTNEGLRLLEGAGFVENNS